MEISASILSEKYKAKDLVKKFNNTSVDFIHLDIMDSKFVENKTWTFTEIKKILEENKKKLDVHLMVKNPIKYVTDYALLNTEYITFHYEAVKNVEEVIEKIKQMGIKVGLSIKPNTKVNDIIKYLPIIDLVLVMSVEPGKSGQKFMESIIYKIDILNKIRNEKQYNFKIEVDGGINNENAITLKEKNVDILVSASYIQEDNTEEKLKLLR